MDRIEIPVFPTAFAAVRAGQPFLILGRGGSGPWRPGLTLVLRGIGEEEETLTRVVSAVEAIGDPDDPASAVVLGFEAPDADPYLVTLREVGASAVRASVLYAELQRDAAAETATRWRDEHDRFTALVSQALELAAESPAEEQADGRPR